MTADQQEVVHYERGEKAIHVTGPYARVIDRGALGVINGCTKEGRFLRQYEAMLTKHVGGNPSITQKLLISRTARLALHLELMDQKVLKNGHTMNATDDHFYVSWSNSLVRHLAKLGLDAPKLKSDKLDKPDSLLTKFGLDKQDADPTG